MEKAGELVAIDGCLIACTWKVREQRGPIVNQHMIVTSMGIRNTGKLVQKEEIEQMVETVCRWWRRSGRT